MENKPDIEKMGLPQKSLEGHPQEASKTFQAEKSLENPLIENRVAEDLKRTSGEEIDSKKENFENYDNKLGSGTSFENSEPKAGSQEELKTALNTLKGMVSDPLVSLDVEENPNFKKTVSLVGKIIHDSSGDDWGKIENEINNVSAQAVSNLLPEQRISTMENLKEIFRAEIDRLISSAGI